MKRKMVLPVHLPDDRMLLGMAVGFLSGLFTGAMAGIAIVMLPTIVPNVPFGAGAYAFGGAVMGVLIGFVIAAISYGIRNSKSTRWYWAIITAAAAGFAVVIAGGYGSFLPMALVIFPFMGAVTGWFVEHILVLIANSRSNPKQEASAPSLILLYLTGFFSCIALVFFAIWLYWKAAAAIA
jgi:MFS family permease